MTTTDGEQPNGPVIGVTMSRTGSRIAFLSRATNLTNGPFDTRSDVFWRDVAEDRTELVTRSFDGGSSDEDTIWRPSISHNGRFVTYESSAENLVPDESHFRDDVFLFDSSYEVNYLVSHGRHGEPVDDDGGRGSYHPTIGASSRYVAFGSSGHNIARGDKPGQDVFLYRIRKVGLDAPRS